MKITIERMPEAERRRRWKLRKLRREQRRIGRRYWPVEREPVRANALAAGSGMWIHLSGEWREGKYIPSDIERSATELYDALEDRIRELEDPCPQTKEAQ